MIKNCIKVTSADIETAKGALFVSALTFDRDISIESVGFRAPCALPLAVRQAG